MANLLLVSAAAKFHGDRDKKYLHMRWKNHLTVYSTYINFDTSTINELQKGLEIGYLLQLPSEASCNFELLANLLATEESVRPFIEVR